MNNWLNFSLQSPHLSLDAVKQQTDPVVSHQAAAARATVSNTTANNSLILSNMSQNHSNSLGAYQSSANDCYNSLRSSGDGGNSSSGQGGLEMMRSDGSLCIMEALSRSHSTGKNQLLHPLSSQTSNSNSVGFPFPHMSRTYTLTMNQPSLHVLIPKVASIDR